jgi:Family of unknown function (DUF6483)
MIRQDYLLRLIEQFGRVWARLVGQLRTGLFPSARATLDQAYQQMLGLTPESVRALPASDLLARMQFAVPPDVGQERCCILSALLKAEGDLANEQQDPDLGAQYYQKALEILVTRLIQYPTQTLPEYAPTVEQLVTVLADYQLPSNSNRLLLSYYEQSGAFARAEDRLFELRDQAPHDRTVAALGEAFYRRLRSYTDAQLQAGDFSRSEIDTGLKAWRRRNRT